MQPLWALCGAAPPVHIPHPPKTAEFIAVNRQHVAGIRRLGGGQAAFCCVWWCCGGGV